MPQLAAPKKGIARYTPTQLAVMRLAAQRRAAAAGGGHPAPAASRPASTPNKHGGKPKKRPNYQGALYDPTQQLSGKDLAGAAHDLTNLEFGPQTSALNRQLGQATRQGTALADRAQGYYQQLDQTDAPIAGQEAAIGQLLSDKLGGNATAANTAIAASLKGAQDRAAADEQVRGQIGGSQTAGASSEAQQAGDVVTENTHAAQDAGTASSADFQQLATLARQSRQQAGGEAHTELLNRLANQQAGYRGQLTDLGRQRGAAQSKNLTDLRQQAYENLVTQAGLQIKQQDLQAQTALGQARINSQAEQDRLNRQSRERIAKLARKATRDATAARAAGDANKVNSYGYTNAEWLALGTRQRQNVIRRSKQSGAVNAGSRQAITGIQAGLTEIQNNVGDVNNGERRLKPLVNKPTIAPLVRELVARGMNALQAKAAAELAQQGYLSDGTTAQLEREGVKVPKKWTRRPPPVVIPTGAAAFGAPQLGGFPTP